MRWFLLADGPDWTVGDCTASKRQYNKGIVYSEANGDTLEEYGGGRLTGW